jgi:predicted ATPase
MSGCQRRSSKRWSCEVSVRGCTVVAIEGTQASGKTTLANALVGELRRRGINAGYVGESARTSPFIDEIVRQGIGTFDSIAEADLFGAQLSAQLRAAREYDLLIADKTIINVVAHVRALLDMRDLQVTELCGAMEAFCTAMGSMYDAVVYCTDRFSQDLVADPLRSKVAAYQGAIDVELRMALEHAGVGAMMLPSGLDTAARVVWTTEQLLARGVV